ncbi:uncharacterized protein MONBRDRAFT_27607 [Monosiga brevicollis MX1]|uniref:Calcineurin-like phosphoesterase domain-containing protein n=1 Tax=Monosiga brevicollis TaxID=81824 RepID=A9V5S5_MONBE|nr:uncharacterized protein MONBRDRAFT_27607 [Monosiga brevicollis MX1]EDQ87167.1 predicted protein [Monosiga brevicollis MX1]|eukprot:XP_001748110.1 hypothetical protein [Monosiga brevicollis MX1]
MRQRGRASVWLGVVSMLLLLTQPTGAWIAVSEANTTTEGTTLAGMTTTGTLAPEPSTTTTAEGTTQTPEWRTTTTAAPVPEGTTTETLTPGPSTTTTAEGTTQTPEWRTTTTAAPVPEGTTTETLTPGPSTTTTAEGTTQTPEWRTTTTPHVSPFTEFLWITDVHYDHFYLDDTSSCSSNVGDSRPEFGRSDCDAPFALLNVSFEAAKLALPDPGFVLVTGDSVRHDMDENFPDSTKRLQLVHDTLQNVSTLLDAHYERSLRLHSPATEAHEAVLNTFGNNDVLVDYQMDLGTNNTLLRAVADAWRAVLTPAETLDVQTGGYMARNVTEHLTIISINTVLYSFKRLPATGRLLPDPYGQFAWLIKQLELVRQTNRQAYIVGHIPPVLDSYFHTDDQVKNEWAEHYVQTFYEILAPFSEQIRAFLFGHLHKTEFRAPPPGVNLSAPIILSCALTPNFGNNPNFATVAIHTNSSQVANMKFYSAPLVVNGTDGLLPTIPAFTQVVDIMQAYPKLTWNAEGMKWLACEIWSNATAKAFFEQHIQKAGSRLNVIEHSTQQWYCLMTHAYASEYKACLELEPSYCTAALTTTTPSSTTVAPNKSNKYKPSMGMAVGIGVGSVVFVGLTLLLATFLSRRRSPMSEYQALIVNYNEEEEHMGVI